MLHGKNNSEHYGKKLVRGEVEEPTNRIVERGARDGEREREKGNMGL